MTKVIVAIVYHSDRGHTARQAEAVRRGAESIDGTTVIYLSSKDALRRMEVLEGADAIIFGCPTFMGSASAPFKEFMDATSKPFFEGKWEGKIAAGFTNSASRSGDKLVSLIQFVILAAQHGMHWVSLGLPPGNNQSDGSEEDLNRLGFWLGAGAQSNADQNADLAPPPSDLRTAEFLGKRVAQTTQQFVRGRSMAPIQLAPANV